MLAEERDTPRRRRAWQASKQIGREAAPKVVELVEARNRAARRMGYRDYYAMSLAHDELDETLLSALSNLLAAKTDALFASEKARLDRALAAKFGIQPTEVGPWHYSDPFFQRAPADDSADLDPIFRWCLVMVSFERALYENPRCDLIDVVLKPGAKWHWNEMIQRATGSRLSEQSFVRAIEALKE